MEDQANIKVFCRFRPLNEKELNISQNFCVNFINEKTVGVNSQYENSEALRFTFDQVFPPTASQEKVYEISAKQIVNAVMQGFNGTILAYGQTSSGKTFTMSGSSLDDEVNMGIIPRMVTTVFDKISEAEDCIEFSVKLSYCEIYLEKIKDLLDTSKTNLKIHEDRARGVYIEGLTEQYVTCDEEVYDLMTIGTDNREVAYTNMNAGSSRSHSLFLLTVGQTNSKDLSAKTGKLYLIDLAGSEKVSKTGAAGKRLEEAKNINKSLTVLGQVIYSLTDGKSSHIPYRNSKLTRVLQDSLGGNSKTCLIVTCSPSPFNEAETVSTLRFGIRAKAIKNKPKVNREYTIPELKLMLSKAQEEIDRKNKYILRLEDVLKKNGSSIPEFDGIKNDEAGIKEKFDYDEVIAEIEELRARLADEVENSHQITEENKQNSAKIQEFNKEKSIITYKCLQLQETNTAIEQKVIEQEGLIEKLVLIKEHLESDNQELLKIKMTMEHSINEKDLEITDLKMHISGNVKKTPEIVYELRGQVQMEKEKNDELNLKVKNLEATLESTLNLIKNDTKNIQEALIKQAVEKEKAIWNEERKSLYRDLKNRINKVIELEITLDNAKEKYESLENALTAGEKKLKQRVDLLSKNMEQLSTAYQQLLNEKAGSKVDLKVIERKNLRLTDQVSSLQEEIKRLELLQTISEAKIKLLEEEIAISSSASRNSISSSRLNRQPTFKCRKSIRGGLPMIPKTNSVLV
ncbi:hypothetical protein SteCoe_11015 [Stentor coeruleus]|uniref:Kinesin-like protein n=1 Tax=Stentor coeruleus TaxID=5963 RepID=A0A1R2CE76_9CILI|nr:hypothetical protein SteCoe_11015 [Stentor coeruleus]